MKKAKTITNDQAARLIGLVDERDELIIRLGIETGLRISDILNLKVGDIRKNPMIIQELKTKKKREVKLSENLHEKLKRYTSYSDSNNFIFESRRSNNHINRVTFHRRIKKALKTLKFEASAHSLRKLYAHNILESTGSIEKVREAMNHTSILTTATYLDIDLTKLSTLEN